LYLGPEHWPIDRPVAADKSLEDGNLAPELSQTILLTAEHAFNITTRYLNCLKRNTQNILMTIQKVGRTTKNRMSPNNYKYFQGYDC
jgi:hypothetical protein